jgi:glutamate racemase
MPKKPSLIGTTRQRDEFVKAGETIHTAVQPTVEPVIQQPVSTAIHLAAPAATEKKKATFNLDAGLHQRLKVAAAVHRREMVDLVEEALEAHLRELEGKI